MYTVCESLPEDFPGQIAPIQPERIAKFSSVLLNAAVVPERNNTQALESSKLAGSSLCL